MNQIIIAVVTFFLGCLLLSIAQCRVYWDEKEVARKRDFCGLFARMRAKRFAKLVHGDVYDKSVARGRGGFAIGAWMPKVRFASADHDWDTVCENPELGPRFVAEKPAEVVVVEDTTNEECPVCGNRQRWPHELGGPGECTVCGNIF